LFPLQSVASQGQAAIKTLQKKSCLKTYRRFFVRSGLCHNRPMNGKTVQWEMGREKPAAGLRADAARPSSAASSIPERFRGVHRPMGVGGGTPPQLASRDAYATAFWLGRSRLARGAQKVRCARPRHSDRPANAGSKDPEFTPPLTAIQPGPIAAGTSQYK
jgi:hypothetical protein